MTLDTALRRFPLLKQLPADEGEPLIVAHGFDGGARVTAAAAVIGAARTTLAFMLGQPGLGGAGQRLERCGSSPAHYHRYFLSLERALSRSSWSTNGGGTSDRTSLDPCGRRRQPAC